VVRWRLPDIDEDGRRHAAYDRRIEKRKSEKKGPGIDITWTRGTECRMEFRQLSRQLFGLGFAERGGDVRPAPEVHETRQPVLEAVDPVGVNCRPGNGPLPQKEEETCQEEHGAEVQNRHPPPQPAVQSDGEPAAGFIEPCGEKRKSQGFGYKILISITFKEFLGDFLSPHPGSSLFFHEDRIERKTFRFKNRWIRCLFDLKPGGW
jgi:hypothetical protein